MALIKNKVRFSEVLTRIIDVVEITPNVISDEFYRKGGGNYQNFIVALNEDYTLLVSGGKSGLNVYGVFDSEIAQLLGELGFCVMGRKTDCIRRIRAVMKSIAGYDLPPFNAGLIPLIYEDLYGDVYADVHHHLHPIINLKEHLSLLTHAEHARCRGRELKTSDEAREYIRKELLGLNESEWIRLLSDMSRLLARFPHNSGIYMQNFDLVKTALPSELTNEFIDKHVKLSCR